MTHENMQLKLAYIHGLKDIVLNEIKQRLQCRTTENKDDAWYIDLPDKIDEIFSLRSVTRAYVVVRDRRYNPSYLSSHKSILGNLITLIIEQSPDTFRSFKISCAGSDSNEVRGIADYAQKTFKLVEKEEADLKIHIIKNDDMWEVGAQISARPLALRAYKVQHMSGAMDPTIAYAINSLCRLEKADSYLNAFSGSGTLLIEAGQQYPNIKRLVGFDNNKKALSVSMQNIKKAGLIKRVEIKERDIFETPDLGTFDVITADLPFGMIISKGHDLEHLYQMFITYAQAALNPNGTLALYTSEYGILEKIVLESGLKIIETLDLKFITNANVHLRPRVFICTKE